MTVPSTEAALREGLRRYRIALERWRDRAWRAEAALRERPTDALDRWNDEELKASYWTDGPLKPFSEVEGEVPSSWYLELKARNAALVEALRYARDAIASPLEPHSKGVDLYETAMMAKALRVADTALAAARPDAPADPSGER